MPRDIFILIEFMSILTKVVTAKNECIGGKYGFVVEKIRFEKGKRRIEK